MKNVMRKVVSLFLVGIVAVSMFGFIAPTRAEATEENSRGTVKVVNKGNYVAFFTISFYDKTEQLIIKQRECLLELEENDFALPANANFVTVEAKAHNGINSFIVDTVKFKLVKDDVYSEDVIIVTTSGTTTNAKVISECTSGWRKA